MFFIQLKFVFSLYLPALFFIHFLCFSRKNNNNNCFKSNEKMGPIVPKDLNKNCLFFLRIKINPKEMLVRVIYFAVVVVVFVFVPINHTFLFSLFSQ